MALTTYRGHVRSAPAGRAPARVAKVPVTARLTALDGFRSPEALLALQRAAGNRATVAFLFGSTRQPGPGPVVQRVLDAAETAEKTELEAWMAAYKANQAASKGRPGAAKTEALRAVAAGAVAMVAKSKRLAALTAKHLEPSAAEQAADALAAATAATARAAAAETARLAAAARVASDAAAATAARGRFATQITAAEGSVTAVEALQTQVRGFIAAVPQDTKLKDAKDVKKELVALAAARLAADRAKLSADGVSGATTEAEANAFQAAGARAVTDATSARDAVPVAIAAEQAASQLSAQTDHTAAAASIARGYQGAVRVALVSTYVSGHDAAGKGYGGEYEPSGASSPWVLHVHRATSGAMWHASTKPGSARGLRVGVEVPMTWKARLVAIGVPDTDTNAGKSFKRANGPKKFGGTGQADLDNYRAGR